MDDGDQDRYADQVVDNPRERRAVDPVARNQEDADRGVDHRLQGLDASRDLRVPGALRGTDRRPAEGAGQG